MTNLPTLEKMILIQNLQGRVEHIVTHIIVDSWMLFCFCGRSLMGNGNIKVFFFHVCYLRICIYSNEFGRVKKTFIDKSMNPLNILLQITWIVKKTYRSCRSCARLYFILSVHFIVAKLTHKSSLLTLNSNSALIKMNECPSELCLLDEN